MHDDDQCNTVWNHTSMWSSGTSGRFSFFGLTIEGFCVRVCHTYTFVQLSANGSRSSLVVKYFNISLSWKLRIARLEMKKGYWILCVCVCVCWLSTAQSVLYISISLKKTPVNIGIAILQWFDVYLTGTSCLPKVHYVLHVHNVHTP